MKIYIIQGSTGEYEDYREWIAKIYADESKAQCYLNELINVITTNGNNHHSEEMKTGLEKLDTNFGYVDYTGIGYTIIEEEVEL